MSAKELGMIHTVNKTIPIPGVLNPQTYPLALGRIDVPGSLTEQLQQMVRAGCYFKTVGIDMSIDLDGDVGSSSVLSRFIRYFAPTRGRCEAFRGAFKSMAQQMTTQGISMRDNKLYDFKVPLNDNTYPTPDVLKNQATLDGSTGLSLVGSTEGASVFAVHNAGVAPIAEPTDIYSQGFRTLLDGGASRTDFVLNDVIPYTGNHDTASEAYETIPFMLNLSTTADERVSPTFQWRPDPALYLAVLCGQFEVVLTDNLTSSGTGVGLNPGDLNVSVMISGWKSIMGNPDKKSSSKKSSKGNRK